MLYWIRKALTFRWILFLYKEEKVFFSGYLHLHCKGRTKSM